MFCLFCLYFFRKVEILSFFEIMNDIKKLVNTYNKLGEEIQKIINKQYKADSIYLYIENDTVYVTRVNYTTSDSKVYMDVIEIKNNHVTKYSKYFNKEKLLDFIEIDVRYWIIIYNLYKETYENINNYKHEQLKNCSNSI